MAAFALHVLGIAFGDNVESPLKVTESCDARPGNPLTSSHPECEKTGPGPILMWTAAVFPSDGGSCGSQSPCQLSAQYLFIIALSQI